MRFYFTCALLIVGLFVSSCNSSKKINAAMNSWVGRSKQELIQQLGPPSETTSDGGGGEILVYANHIYRQILQTTQDYWHYRMWYVRADGTIYHWLWRNNPNPPQRVDVRLMIQ